MHIQLIEPSSNSCNDDIGIHSVSSRNISATPTLSRVFGADSYALLFLLLSWPNSKPCCSVDLLAPAGTGVGMHMKQHENAVFATGARFGFGKLRAYFRTKIIATAVHCDIKMLGLVATLYTVHCSCYNFCPKICPGFTKPKHMLQLQRQRFHVSYACGLQNKRRGGQ